ncbi:hypothetical protein MBFIL_07180 [Methanobrevibacter filiformis]|uniref:Uncharacterized protein n=2 Tax=Methanobrevibacter filiformis TaxID=55758 RepID=A0A166D377_9EURY|nr:hypothetical protein MBFIL_07180 [Methanobrevibacter filiformis]
MINKKFIFSIVVISLISAVPVYIGTHESIDKSEQFTSLKNTNNYYPSINSKNIIKIDAKNKLTKKQLLKMNLAVQ